MNMNNNNPYHHHHTFPTGNNPNAHPFHPTAPYFFDTPNDPTQHTQQQQTPHPTVSSTTTNTPSPQVIHDWYEVSCVRAGAPDHETNDAICALSFDTRKELIWVATASGMIHAHLASDMSRIVSSYISEPVTDVSQSTHIRDICVSPDVVLAAMSYGLAVVSRGGVIRSSVRADAVKNAKALALNPMTEGRHVCIGGDSRMLSVIDVETARIVRQATLRGSTGVTAACWSSSHENSSNLAIFTTATGRISLCDPSTMREANAIAAFTGAATSVSTCGNYIAATGMASRGGVSYLEQQVKLFDIRSVETPLPSVLFPDPPTRVIFDPCTAQSHGVSLAMWAVSPNGLLQLLDVSRTPATPLIDEIQLDAGSDILTSLTVSSQGLLVLGDSGGFVHEWACTDVVKVNDQSEPLWDPETFTSEPPTPSINLDELMASDFGATVDRCNVPDYNRGFLSDEMFEPPSTDYTKVRSSHHQHHPRIARAIGVLDSTLDAYKDLVPREPYTKFPPIVADDIVQRATHGQTSVAFTQAPPNFIRNSQSGHKKPPVVRGVRIPGYNVRRSGAHYHGMKHGDSGLGMDSRTKRNVGTDGKVGNKNKGKNHGNINKDGKLDLSKPVSRCSYVEMDLVAWESIEGFDFLKYNQSGLFCGLENALPNVYVNSVVQTLYFTPPIRRAVAAHQCDRDWCISCELGFLFHMFDLGGAGMACEAGNFTRAFMTMANTGALGLLDGPHALPLSERIENFSRYLLEQLHKDDELVLQSGQQSKVSMLYGGDTISYGNFTSSNTKWERWSRPFQHSLVYDDDLLGGVSQGLKNVTLNQNNKNDETTEEEKKKKKEEARKKKEGSFCTLLERCLWQTLDPTRAFCEPKQQFETMTHRRELRGLPNVLLLGCNTKAKGYAQWWVGQDDTRHHFRHPYHQYQHQQQQQQQQHQHQQQQQNPGIDIDEIARRAIEDMPQKLVESIKIDMSKGGINVSEIDTTQQDFGYDENKNVQECEDEMAEYGLSFVIAHVKAHGMNDKSGHDLHNDHALGGIGGNSNMGMQDDGVKYGRRNAGGHLVAYIRVAEGYRKRKEEESSPSTSPSTTAKGSEWWCFNDFVISKVTDFREVGAFHRQWKMPCLIGYVRRDVKKRTPDVDNWWSGQHQQQQSVRQVIGYENQNAAIGLQHDEETPGQGSVLGLDCEFVMVSREEAEIYGDGKREVVVPARKALARVSVIRGYGRLQGEAMMDDYVCVREPVVDYLTRFSGLIEGDLTPGRSRYVLSSLKAVYKKLRCLVDAGCVFVGHGLKSDFRIINFVVPPQQVIDTVTMFRLPHKRLLGLRFLSHALLGDEIQSETHDSIEDANAALTLYLLYVGLKSVGDERFERVLKELYAYGYRYGWKVEPSHPFKVNWNSAL